MPGHGWSSRQNRGCGSSYRWPVGLSAQVYRDLSVPVGALNEANRPGGERMHPEVRSADLDAFCCAACSASVSLKFRGGLSRYFT
eukprot:5823701-Pleurochrysis_carterae.AAC.2